MSKNLLFIVFFITLFSGCHATSGLGKKDGKKQETKETKIEELDSVVKETQQYSKETKDALADAETGAKGLDNLKGPDGKPKLPDAESKTFCGYSKEKFKGGDLGGWVNAKKECIKGCEHDYAILCTRSMLTLGIKSDRKASIDQKAWVGDHDYNCLNWTSPSSRGATTDFIINESQGIKEDFTEDCSQELYLACCL